MRESTRTTLIFRSGRDRWIIATAWGVLLLLGLAGMFNPDGDWFAWLMFLVGVLCVGRCVYACALLMDANTLVIRSWEWTKKIPLADIQSVRYSPVPNMLGSEQLVLFVTTKDGKEKRYVSISGPKNPRKPIHDLPAAVELIQDALPH